jgi:TP901 family phage tail tape measure protein
MSQAEQTTKRFGSTTLDFARKNEQHFNTLGYAALGLGAAIGGGLGLAVKSAMDFESSFAGVRKTVDASEAEFAALEKGFRGLATEIPISVNELNRIGEAAGQLGIEQENILGFTRVMADLGVATNLSSDQAATSLARLANITQMSETDFDRLGSTIVALGNNLATTESEIVEMGLRIAGAGKQVGLTEAEILSFAGALSSVGIEAEAGGTAFSRVMIDMANAAASGGGELEGFAKVAGMSAEEFRRSFEEDAAGAITTFVGGLGRISESGGNVFAVLEQLGLADIRVRDALLRMSGAQDVMTGALKIGTEAWKQNTALVDEATKRYATAESRIAIAGNQLNDFAIDIGSVLLPVVASAAEAVGSLAGVLGSLPGPAKTAGTGIAALTAAAALAGGGLLLFLPRIAATKAAMDAMGLSGTRAGAALVGFGKAAGVAAAVVPLALAVDQLGKSLMGLNADLTEVQRGLLGLKDGEGAGAILEQLSTDADGFKEAIHSAAQGTGVLDKLWRGLWSSKSVVEMQREAEQIEALDQGLANLVRTAGPQAAGMAFEKLSSVLRLTSHDVEALRPQLDAYTAAQAENELQTESQAAAQRDAALATGEIDQATADLMATMGLSEDQLKAMQERWDALSGALMSFTDPIAAYDNALDLNKTAMQDWAQAQADATEDSSDSWEDFVADVGVSLTDYEAQLQKQVDAQNEWRSNLAAIALSGRGDVIEQLMLMGEKGHEVAALFAENLGAEGQRAMDLFLQSVQGGGKPLDEEMKVLTEIGRRGAKATVDEIAKVTGVLPAVVRQIAQNANIELQKAQPAWGESWGWRARHAVGEMGALRGQAPPIVGDAAEQVNRQARDREPAWMDSWGWRTRHAVGEMGALRGQVPPMVGQTADGMNHELGSRLPNFQRIVADYQNALASGVRTVGIALGEKYSSINFLADGGIVNFADGGVKESHQAQIARAGDWRVWAEPETGGEAYIPLSPSKRARSMGILEEVADRFGMEVTPPTLDYHSGGLYTPPGSPSFDDYGPPIRPAGADTTDSMEEAIAEWARRHMQLPHHTEPVGGGGDYAGGGKALDRVRSMLGDFPGLRITSTYRSPEHNRRIGGAKNSYHMDRNNPAVDVAGSHGQMSAFAAAARRAGGWREGPLWQVKGHYDHVHVAEDGTIIDFKSFDRGGILEPGLTLAHNGTGQPEVVTTASNVPTPAQTGVERYGPQSSPNAPTPNQYAGTARYGPQSMTIQVGAANAPAGSQTSGLDRYGPQTRPGSSANNVPTLNQTTGIDRYGDQLAESVDGVRSGSVNSLATVEARLLSIDQRLGSIEGVLTTPAPVPATTNERRQTVPSMAQRFGMNEEEWAQRFEQMIPTLAQRLGMAEDEWASFDARRRPNEAPTPAEAHGMTEPEWESYIARTRPNTAPTMAQRTATYDDGGWLMPGWTNAYNGTGKPERVLPDEAPVLLSYDDLRARVDDLALTLEAQLGPVEKPSAMSPVEDRKDKLVERSLGMGHEQGSIFNPYIRDAGGPLLPGYTYNGTGRPEQVVPASISPAGGSVVYQDNRTIKISGHTAWSLREFQRAMEKIDKDRSYVGGRR